MSDDNSIQFQQANKEQNKENEEVRVRTTSPDPSVVFGTPQTHYHQHDCVILILYLLFERLLEKKKREE